MLNLSGENFQKAAEYIKKNADEIDLAWYCYNFEGMCEDDFLDVLSKYQYDNGGFGGLVYEYAYNGPLCTTQNTLFAIFFI